MIQNALLQGTAQTNSRGLSNRLFGGVVAGEGGLPTTLLEAVALKWNLDNLRSISSFLYRHVWPTSSRLALMETP